MQISNIKPAHSSSQASFRGLNIDKSFYETASYLNQNIHTQENFQKAYQELQKAAEKKNITINGLDKYGASIVEIDEKEGIAREIAKSFQNAISAMWFAVQELNKKNNPKNNQIRERFPGHGNLGLKA